MLVLSRKPGEKIRIETPMGDIFVTPVRIGPNTVRLGIEAPRCMNIVRTELIVEDEDDTQTDETRDDRPQVDRDENEG